MNEQGKTIRALIANGNKIILQGLNALFESDGRLVVVGLAESGLAAIELAQKTHPDVIIIDVAMPDLNGVDATRRILAKSPNVKVIGLSVDADRGLILEMFRAGAVGYLLKGCAYEELVHAIEVAVAGHVYLSPRVADVVIREYVQMAPSSLSSAFDSLTERERQMLQMLAEGKTTKQVAAKCFVSVKTVDTHRQNIMDKLGLKSLPELTKYAVREGLTDLE